MKNCFLCGIPYDENNREVVGEIEIAGEEEPAKIAYISTGEVRWALCPDCTRAAALGVAAMADNMTWLGPFEFETENNEDQTQD